MVGPSINSHHLNSKPPSSAPAATIKFLCSYGGKIVPRHPDGKLRYHGGETRVLAVDRSVSFAELLMKLGEMCGASVSLRCQLPREDLDALVSITSDEDLANLIEEYDQASSPPSSLKIRGFLSLPKSSKRVSPHPSVASSSSNDASATSSNSSQYSAAPVAASASFPRYLKTPTQRCIHQTSKPAVFPLCYEKAAGKVPKFAYHGHGNTSHMYLIHHGNHWQ